MRDPLNSYEASYIDLVVNPQEDIDISLEELNRIIPKERRIELKSFAYEAYSRKIAFLKKKHKEQYSWYIKFNMRPYYASVKWPL